MLRALVIAAVVLFAAPFAGTDEPPEAGSTLVSAATFEAGSGIVRSLAWSPDKTHLAAGCSDATLRIWKPPLRRPGVALKVSGSRRGCLL